MLNENAETFSAGGGFGLLLALTACAMKRAAESSWKLSCCVSVTTILDKTMHYHADRVGTANCLRTRRVSWKNITLKIMEPRLIKLHRGAVV